MKTKILVTGGAGNIGGALAKKLVTNPDFFVVIVDNLSTGSRDKLPSNQYKNWLFVQADVNNYNEISAVILAHKFTYIYHLAAVVGVARTQRNPLSVLNDIQGIRNVLDLAKGTSVRRVFYSSSSEVYGDTMEFPQNEMTTPLNARVPYAAVKNIGEAFFRSYQKTYGLDYTIFRFFNTYGPNQSMDFVIPKFMHLALNNRDITIYGDGLQTRTFLYIDDNIELCTKVLTDDLVLNDVINVGGDREVTILELANTIIDICGSSSKIVHLPPLEEGDMVRRVPDNRRMKRILNRELLSLEDGIRGILEDSEFLLNRIASDSTGVHG